MRKLLIYCLVSAAGGVVLGILIARALPPSRAQVASYLSSLSVGDLADLTRTLQEKWGVEPAPSSPVKIQKLELSR